MHVRLRCMSTAAGAWRVGAAGVLIDEPFCRPCPQLRGWRPPGLRRKRNPRPGWSHLGLAVALTTPRGRTPDPRTDRDLRWGSRRTPIQQTTGTLAQRAPQKALLIDRRSGSPAGCECICCSQRFPAPVDPAQGRDELHRRRCMSRASMQRRGREYHLCAMRPDPTAAKRGGSVVRRSRAASWHGAGMRDSSLP